MDRVIESRDDLPFISNPETSIGGFGAPEARPAPVVGEPLVVPPRVHTARSAAKDLRLLWLFTVRGLGYTLNCEEPDCAR